MDGQRQDVVVYVDDGFDINNHLSLVVCARDRSGCEVQVVCAIQQEVFMQKDGPRLGSLHRGSWNSMGIETSLGMGDGRLPGLLL